ncbi:RNA 3'-terminal phosphate cyclase-domain-containing protein [Coniella lustricola]|uniref:RNA 3'-terminal phosphate cyclase-domain-containing protein n=1 Tax=Coniella lustricola TaxID=2025994 RepID=A0A2T3ALH5_9PEZI|nr:RNA 3'-terminal phosphate cyclase-domain-containing protein [Coniella lustricola]
MAEKEDQHKENREFDSPPTWEADEKKKKTLTATVVTAKQEKMTIIEAPNDASNGQVVRMAVALSAITTTPVKVLKIRALEKTPGMTPGLVAIVKWLANNTSAELEGNKLGSETLSFVPKHTIPPKLINKEIKLNTGSMTASSVIFLETVLPVLLFVGGGSPSVNAKIKQQPVEVSIDGASNCLEAPSYEYLDQIYLPALEKFFGIQIISQLTRRGWSQMTPDPKTVQKGKIRVKFMPLEVGTTLQPRDNVKLCDDDEHELLNLMSSSTLAVTSGNVLPNSSNCNGNQDSDTSDSSDSGNGATSLTYGTRFPDTTIERLTATIVTAAIFHRPLMDALREDIENRFPGAELTLTCEESGHIDRFYVLLVARSRHCQWARDVLSSKRLKEMHVASLAKETSSQVVKELESEVNGSLRGDCPIDVHLQDQLVIFQALAEGKTCFPRNRRDQSAEAALRNLHPDFPLKEDDLTTLGFKDSLSNDSEHAHRARYVAKMMLPDAKFYNGGKVCVGAALQAGGKK